MLQGISYFGKARKILWKVYGFPVEENGANEDLFLYSFIKFHFIEFCFLRVLVWNRNVINIHYK